MIAAKWYLRIKPHVPWAFRMAVRRRWAARMRRKYADVWPIDASAARTPPNWPGWPGGKQFGLVLTHDVETGRGLTKIPKVIALEQRYGFQSAFNLVPKGEYSVPPAVREYIQSTG